MNWVLAKELISSNLHVEMRGFAHYGVVSEKYRGKLYEMSVHRNDVKGDTTYVEMTTHSKKPTENGKEKM